MFLSRLPAPRKPIGYWQDFANIRSAILELNQERGRLGMMPTAKELKDLGRSALLQAISKHYGGFQSVAERLGLTYRQKRSRYWYDFENVKQELFTFIREQGSPGIMPTKTELEAAKRGSLCAAIDIHGGFPAVAQQLNLELSYGRKPRGYWKNLDNLKVEIANVAEQLGKPDMLPLHEELTALGRTDLISAIAKNGGWPSVARKIGFSYSKQYNNPNDFFERKRKEQ